MVNTKKLAWEILKAEEMGRAVARAQKNIQQREARQVVEAEAAADADRKAAIIRDPSWMLPPSPREPPIIAPRPAAPPIEPPPAPPTRPKATTFHVTKKDFVLDTTNWVVVDREGEGYMEEFSLRGDLQAFSVVVQVDDFTPIYENDFAGFLADSLNIGAIAAWERPDETYPYQLSLAPVSFARRLRVEIATTTKVTFGRIFLKWTQEGDLLTL